MSDKRRGLGRGLGALIPSAPPADGQSRPSDVFFQQRPGAAASAARSSVAERSVRSARAVGPGSAEPGSRQEGTSNPVDTDTRGETRPGNEPGGDEQRADGQAVDASVSSAPAVDSTTTADVDTQRESKQKAPESDGAAGQGQEDSTTRSSGRAQADSAADQELAPVPGARFAEVPVGAIRPNPRQPRQVFDEDEMAELVHSIREIGVLQPIVVRPLSSGGEDRTGDATADGVEPCVEYELIMGERRWRASQQAGNDVVPAIVRETSDDDLLRDALLENLHRAQLNPLEEAAAYAQLLQDFGCTHDELAGRIGRSRPQISNTLRLMKLPPLVQRRLAAGVLSAGHARALLGLPDAAAMERLAQRIVAEGLSVRTVEEIVSMGGDQQGRRRASSPRQQAPEMDDLAARLSDRLDTRVGISVGRKKGKLTVEFASVDDLNRIIDLLGLEQP